VNYILFSLYTSGMIRVREGELFETLEEAQEVKAEYEAYSTKRKRGDRYRLFRLEEVTEAS
jgi:hypothetical protein